MFYKKWQKLEMMLTQWRSYGKGIHTVSAKQLCLGELCQRLLDLRLSGISLDLKFVRSARCLQHFGIQMEIQPYIYCLVITFGVPVI